MSRNPEYQFIDAQPDQIVRDLTRVYESVSGTTLQPGSPERLILQWLASALLQQRSLANYAANQNLPSRAEGQNLDALAALYHAWSRPQAKSARCTVRFSISCALDSAVLIPAGTRVTDTAASLIWHTEADAYIPAGETALDLPVVCQTPGLPGNGYTQGQINTIVDRFDFCSGCANITASAGGSDEATDDEFYDLLRLSMDAYSCAGSRGSYIYFAKQVSTEIADVTAIAPEPGVVELYVLMADGSPAGDEIKRQVLAACSAEEVRPLTDLVRMGDPDLVPYDIHLTYYIEVSSDSPVKIQEAVKKAVDAYVSWQRAKLGRNISPDMLRQLLYDAGASRIVLDAPEFTPLRDGSDESVPQAAVLNGTPTVLFGGFDNA